MLLFPPFFSIQELPAGMGPWLSPNWEPDNSPRDYLGSAHLSSPAQIRRLVETVSQEMSVCLGFADVSLKVLYQSQSFPL